MRRKAKHPDFVPPKPVSLSKDYDDPTSVLGRNFANVDHAPAFAILGTKLGEMVTRLERGTGAPDALAIQNYAHVLPAARRCPGRVAGDQRARSAAHERRPGEAAIAAGCRLRRACPRSYAADATVCLGGAGGMCGVHRVRRRTTAPSALRQGSGGLAPAALVKHVVVIFQENVSFDHYFATYPHAANLPGERAFTPLPGTPAVAGLSGELLTKNPNFTNPANGADAANPYRLASSQAATADQDHSYTQEQLAYDHGKMDFFPGSLGQGDTPPGGRGPPGAKIAQPRVLRRQHGDRALELRAAVRDERSLFPDDLRAVGARGVESGVRPDQRRGGGEKRREPERA